MGRDSCVFAGYDFWLLVNITDWKTIMRAFLLLILIGLSSLAVYAADEPPAEEEVVHETAYYELKPSIVSNLHGKAKYIRTSIQLMTNRADLLHEIETHTPALRHEILMILAEKKGEDIMDNAGKEALRQELLAALNKVLNEKNEDKDLITDLFFTAYYVK